MLGHRTHITEARRTAADLGLQVVPRVRQLIGARGVLAGIVGCQDLDGLSSGGNYLGRGAARSFEEMVGNSWPRDLLLEPHG